MRYGFYIAYPTGLPPTPHRHDDRAGQRVMIFDTRAGAQAHADTLEIPNDVYRTTKSLRALIASEEAFWVEEERIAAEWRADAMDDLADREDLDLVDDDSAERPQQ